MVDCTPGWGGIAPLVTRPLVSVMLPCFNAEKSLARALASLRCQSLSDWECLCVDDGSRDNTGEMLREAAGADARIKPVCFDRNRGRGAARQSALVRSTGKYLAFLDADDWMFPSRLARQVARLEDAPDVAAVSACAAVTRSGTELVGVLRPRIRGSLAGVHVLGFPSAPAVVFPATMIRADLAQAAGFNPGFRRAEDFDFLVRALLGRAYLLESAVLYAYGQESGGAVAATLESYEFQIRSLLGWWREYPGRVLRGVVEARLKKNVYRLAAAGRVEHYLVNRRCEDPTEQDRLEFEVALRRVRDASA